jgi:hypothetical protein
MNMYTTRIAPRNDGIAPLDPFENVRLTGGDGGGCYQPPAAPESQPPTIGASLIAGLVNH